MNQIIHPRKSLKNIGAIFDETVSMFPQINSICKSAFFHLKNISRIRKYLSRTATERLINAFVTSKLDSFQVLVAVIVVVVVAAAAVVVVLVAVVVVV